MVYAALSCNNLDFDWSSGILSATFASFIDIHIIIQVLESCKYIWDFNLIMFLTSHIWLYIIIQMK